MISQVKGLGVPIMRYPGGNFVSGYNWLDGVGPKDKRPTVLERAWNSIETNQFGTNEFMDWCKLVGTEPLLGMNFGTGSAEMAVGVRRVLQPGQGDEVERPQALARLRRAAQRALLVPRQRDGRPMADRAHARPRVRPEGARRGPPDARHRSRSQLIACGSSNREMPTYLVWDREVLEECYDQVDAISLHCYYGNTKELSGENSARGTWP